MEQTIIIARFLGLFFTIFGISVVVGEKRYKGALQNIIDYPAFQVFAALLPTLMGSYIVASHNVWDSGLPCLITALGWLMLLGGAFRGWLTERWVALAKSVKDKVPFQAVGAVVTLLGLTLCYLGFNG